ncbi:hypothetical protein [Micromonospora haikouensis]|uniref:hypothetical protein n=1 Tax=Micromonospora haikouensis TaxID=686309 RepID=UPI003D70AF65
MSKPIARLEQDLIAARGDEKRHAAVRDQIRDAGLPHLAAELNRIAATDPEQER